MKKGVALLLALVLVSGSAGEAIGAEVVEQPDTLETDYLFDSPEESTIEEVYGAGETYNAAAALDYAKKHWNDGKGLCAEFVSDCLNAGGCSAWNNGATSLRRLLLASGMGQEYTLSYDGGYINMRTLEGKLSPGDAVFFACFEDQFPYEHVVLCKDADSNGYMRAYSHNNANDGSSAYAYGTYCPTCGTRTISAISIYHFNTSVGHSPVGYLDGAEGGEGTVHVWGWAYDPDDLSAKVKLDVYVGGNVGSGAKKYQITADKLFENADNIYHCGRYHGFDETIQVDARGNQPIYVHAYDVGAIAAENIQLTNSPRTASIKNVPFRIDYPGDFVVKEGESKSFTFTFQGDGIYNIAGEQPNDGVASIAVNSIDWSKRSVPVSITVKGLKEGKSSATFKLVDKSGSTLYSKKATVQVSATTKKVTGVSLDKQKAELKTGASLTLKATIAPSNATNQNVSWSSSNTSVATVDGKGLVTAKTPGTTNITVTTKDGGYTAKCAITVYRAVTGVSLNRESANLKIGDSMTLKATISPADATNQNVSWSSSNTSVATVDGKGVITPIAPGTTDITVTTKDGGYTAKCIVTVYRAVTGVSLNKESAKLQIGDGMTLKATITPENATNQNVSWSSSNTSVATVSGKGYVTSKNEGETIITVKTWDGEYTATCKVIVEKKPEDMKQPENTENKDDSENTESKDNTENTEKDNTGDTDNTGNTEQPENEPSDESDIIAVVKQKVDITDFLPQTYGKYQVSPKDRASVSAKGILTVKKAGEITITGLVKEGKKWVADSENAVTVSAELPKFQEKTVVMNYIGASFNAEDNLAPSECVVTSWTSSNPKVATVDASTGTVEAVKQGSAKITAVYGIGKQAAKYSFTVKVVIPSISKKKATMLSGATLTLKLNKARSTPVWSSEDEEIASVDESTGRVTGVSAGSTTITASLDGVEYSCAVTVKKPTLSFKKATLKVGKTKKITLKNTKLKNAVWESMDESVATIDENGVITAIAPGKAEIMTTTGGCESTCVITVK